MRRRMNRMDGYRKAAGLRDNNKICKYCVKWNPKSHQCSFDLKIHKAEDGCFNWIKRVKKETILELIKRQFSYERSTGIVNVSTVPFVTERWVGSERQIGSFMVTLPRWVSEEKVLEAINIGFGFLEEEAD